MISKLNDKLLILHITEMRISCVYRKFILYLIKSKTIKQNLKLLITIIYLLQLGKILFLKLIKYVD